MTVLMCLYILHYYYYITVLYYVRHLEHIWIYAIQIPF